MHEGGQSLIQEYLGHTLIGKEATKLLISTSLSSSSLLVASFIFSISTELFSMQWFGGLGI